MSALYSSSAHFIAVGLHLVLLGNFFVEVAVAVSVSFSFSFPLKIFLG